MEFCPPGHKHDAFCDPTLSVPLREPDPDPSGKAHRAHMEQANQDGWLAWQLSRSLTGPKPMQPVPVKKKGVRR